MVKDVIVETAFIDLSDDQLRHRLGFLWEQQKRVQEAAGNDQVLQELDRQYKQHYEEHYGMEIKILRKRLAAARRIAQLREITWEPEL